MKRTIFLSILALSLLSTMAVAEVPGFINYQGVLTDEYGAALDTTLSLIISIHDDSTGGSQLWTETQSGIDIQQGLFNILLGKVSSIPDTVFQHSNCWLSVQVSGDAPLEPRQRITCVGYAFRAAQADTADFARMTAGADGWVDDGTAVYLTGLGDSVGIGTDNPTEPLQVVGRATMSDLLVSYDAKVYGGLYASDYIHRGDQSAVNLMDIWGLGGVSISNSTGYSRTPAPEGGMIIQGDVGIGTTSPGSKLEVAGTVHSTSGGFKFPDNSVQTSAAVSSGWVDDGTAVYLTGLGDSVGIGTDNPGFELHVVGTGYLEDDLLVMDDGTMYGGLWVGDYIRRGDQSSVNLMDIYGYGGATISNSTGYSRTAAPLGGLLVQGDVGIGTTSPGSKLEVAGTVHSTSGGFKFPDNSVQTSAAVSSGWVDDGTAVYLTGLGDSVGIGTDNPTEPLQVVGRATMSDLLVSYDAKVYGGLYASDYIHRGDQSAVNLMDIWGLGGVSISNSTGYSRTPAPEGGMIIQGDVGIGTTSPGSKLEVAGTVHSTSGGFKFPDNSVQTSAAVSSGWVDDGTAVYLAGVGDSVGIGTDNPGFELHVVGTGYLEDDLLVMDDGTMYGGLWVGDYIRRGDQSSVNLMDIYGYGGATISNSTGYSRTAAPLGGLLVQGDVGIGTTSPGSKLEVAGTVHSTSGGFKFPDNSVQTSAAVSSGWVDDGTAVYLTGLGDSVGIGTDNPTEPLQVVGRATMSDVLVSNDADVYGGLYVSDHIHRGDQSAVNLMDIYGNGGVSISNSTGYSRTSAPEGGMIVQGHVGIGTNNPVAKLDVIGDRGYNQVRMRTSYTPSGTGDSNGDVGDIAWDNNYVYIKTSGGWKRSELRTF